MRRDIQFLRGVAVLLVVIFHATLGIVNNGYLGVDVFFVVSGFLITSIILKDLDAQNFSFAGFYRRRAKRLLPALYFTLACTSLLAYGFLTSTQWNDFIAQLIGAVTFSANLVLPTQIGYFEAAAEGKPLLHIWSLSLEEQYYFLLPLFLYLTPRQWRFSALIAATAVSLGWCLFWTSSPDAIPPFLWRFGEAKIAEWAFYLFPTRAWELLVGSICAWLMLNRPGIAIHPGIKLVALAVIVTASCISLDSIHPRGNALIVVIATATIILGKDNWLPRFRVLHGIERIGDWSYSIYLVHWPLFAFAYLGYVGLIPDSSKILLVFIAVLLGYFQYRFIEIPFRYGWKTQSHLTWAWFAASTVVVFLIPAPMVLGKSESRNTLTANITEIRKVNYGLSENCAKGVADSGLDPECTTGVKPKLAVWGDSFAMHLIPGIAKGSEDFIQLTKSSCGPILGIAPIIAGRYSQGWAKKCSEHNDNAFRTIIETDSITHVVLSSTFGQYFNGRDAQFLLDGMVVDKDPAVAIEALILTIEKLQLADKHPILISPPPRSGFNIGDCLERQDFDLIVFRKSCDILFSEYANFEKDIIQSLADVERKTGVEIIWLKDFLGSVQNFVSIL
ncbi:MAG: acyltransferase [Hahellaceae bacterium]|nr:acyltransferase [Hahellaceae bacterium]